MSIQASGLTTRCTEKESTNGLMVANTLDSTYRTRRKDMARWNGLMVASIKDTIRMESRRVLESTSTAKVKLNMEYGSKARGRNGWKRLNTTREKLKLLMHDG